VGLGIGASLTTHAVNLAAQSERSCDSAMTTAAMKTCESTRYEKAQRDLDTTYQVILKKLDSTGQSKLRAAQTAWLRYRQANANYAADAARGGTLGPLIQITVFADMTEARAAELKKALKPSL
jgi:uncharacterized protein YecT (DUF1311 family)